MKKRTIVIIVIVVLIVLWAYGSSLSSSKDETELIAEETNVEAISEEKGVDAEVSKDTEASKIDWLQYYEDQGLTAYPIDADILYQYGEYLPGELVYTAFVVDSAEKTSLKANTDSNDSFFYSILCNFEDSNEIKNVGEEDAVVVIGTVDSASHTVDLDDCHLLMVGTLEDIQDTLDMMASNTDAQIEWALQKKDEQEAAQAEQYASEKQAYVDECESVNYTDVERNPDDFDGKQIKVSGKVIQVSEGIFNSVTLRVQQSDGNIWYVTYTRSEGESRILEGDSVTIYGKCSGVTSYTNVVGGRVTIPSVRAEYIDF